MPFQSEEITELGELTRSEIEPGAMLTFRAARLIVSDEPAAVVMLDEGTLRPRSGAATMLVYNPKPAVLDALRGTVSEREWIEGGGDMEAVQRVGALAGGILVAMATAEQPTGARRRRLSRFGALALWRFGALAHAVGFVAFARALTRRPVAADLESGVLQSE